MSEMFGTDGVRGQFGVEPITPQTVQKLGWAVGSVLAESHARNHVLIGKDTRISGYILESALESGFASAGVNVSLLGPMPTPGIAYLTRSARATIGVVVSASHNPFEDNGIKFFSSKGYKLDDALIAQVEAKMEENFHTVSSKKLGKAHRFTDAIGRYIEFCKHSIPYRVNFDDFRIVVDCAHGAAYHIAPQVFDELGAEVIPIGVHPDGFNINKNCGSTSLDAVQEKVKETKADLGIALDGDGDRVLFIDEAGNEIDGDQVLYILAHFQKQKQELQGGIIGTLMTNLGLEVALKQAAIPFERTQVGDRFVLERLIEKDWLLGGETSGHIICLDKNTTGDGIVAALQIMRVMRSTQKPLSELAAGMDRYPQIMINVPVARHSGKQIMASPILQDALQACEAEMGEAGRIILRPSGTEPLLRVTVEGDSADQVKLIADQLAAVVETVSSTI